MTSHPVDFTEDLIDAHHISKKLMPLIHLPVQSGSNKILKSMNRNHTVKDYLNIIDKLKKINPYIKFSSDFIIGYPGETKYDFDDTLKLLKKVEFINSYSFIFSPRPGTPAAKMRTINKNIAKDRLINFQKAAEKIKINHKKSLFNKVGHVLFENRIGSESKFLERDEYMNSVIVKSDENLIGKIKEVCFTGGNQTTLLGTIKQKINNKKFCSIKCQRLAN